MKGFSGDTSRVLWKNSVSQVLGRLVLSFARFLAAVMVVRYSGTERFGEYVLVLNFLFLFEFLTEFGQVDIAVREICQKPERESAILSAVARLQIIQGGLFAVLLSPLVYLLNYDLPVVHASLIGSVGVICYASLQAFRTMFKVHMRMERDVIAELAGMAVMLPMTWAVCSRGGGLEALISCYTASRVVFFGMAVWFGRGALRSLRMRVAPAEAMKLWRETLPLGFTGLAVAVYDGLAPIILSKTSGMNSLAQLGGVGRYFFPVLVIVQAITTAFYPMLSRYWSSSRAELRDIQQVALEAALVLGAGFACGIFASAGFLMRLIGPSLEDAAGLLELMACVLVARTLTAALSPLIIVAGRQTATLWLGMIAIALHAILLIVLIPRFGVIGVAVSYLLVEFVAGAVPLAMYGQFVSGVRLNWGPPLIIIGAAVAATAISSSFPISGTVWNGIAAGVLYLAFLFATGVVSPRRLQGLVGPAAPAPAVASSRGSEPP